MKKAVIRVVALVLMLSLMLPVVAAAGSIKMPYIGVTYVDGSKTVGNRARVGYGATYLILALDDQSWSWDQKKTSDGTKEGFFSSDGLGGFYYFGENDQPIWSLSSGAKAVLKVRDDGIAEITRKGSEEGYLGSLQVEMKLTRYEQQGSRLVKSKTSMSAITSVDLIGDNEHPGMILVTPEEEAQQTEPEKTPSSAEGESDPFVDVKESDWFYDSFMKLYRAGYLHGVDLSAGNDGSKFVYMKKTGEHAAMSLVSQAKWVQADKAATVTEGAYANGSTASTRAATVSMLYNMSKQWKKIAGGTQNPFGDVAQSAPYADPIAWAADKGVVNGYGEGKFGPNDPITREQMCAILVRLAEYLGKPLPKSGKSGTFTDGGKIAAYAAEAVTACQRAGIVSGYPDGTFRPNAPITRNEVCKMLASFEVAVK